MSIVKVMQEIRFAEKSSVTIVIDEEKICLVKVQDSYHAFSAYCTHIGVPFKMDTIDGDMHCITCPLHGSIFDINTGQVLQGPAKQPLRLYPVSIQDGWVCLDVVSE